MEERAIREFVSQAFEQAKGEAIEASKILESWAKKDRSFADVILMPQLPSVCWQLVREYCQEERRLVWNYPTHSVSGNGDRIKSLADETAKMFMEMYLPIPGLPKLGDATKEQIEEAAYFCQKQSIDMRQKADFFFMVHRSVKKGKPVRSQLTEQKLKDFHASAIGGGK